MVGRGVEEIGVAEQPLLAPHDLLAAHRHRVQHRVANEPRQFFRPTLDDGGARVRFAVDRVAKTHDFFLPLEHGEHSALGLLRAAPLLDHRHRGLVGAAMERAAQGTDGGGDATVQIGQRRGDDPRGEG